MSALPKGIRKRGDSYVADVTVAGRRRTASAPTLEEAIVLRAELAGRPMPLGPRPQPVWTIQRSLGVAKQVAWRDTDWGVSAVRMATEFGEFFGMQCPLDQVTTEGLDQWCRSLEEARRADATINRYLAAASKLMTVAQERGGLGGKPKFPRRREQNGRVRFLTKDEEATLLALLDQWDKLEERDLVVVLVDTGLRLGEALRLEARDIDLKSGVVNVWETKNGEPRSVPMTKRVRAVLERRPGFKINRYTFRAAWDRARSRMGLAHDKQFVPHALRHTCASRLVQRGVGLKVVQQWMGHKNIQVTLRYAHLSPTSLIEAAKVLEEEET